jgi:predicted Ser/Thr protein kinase
VSCPHCQASLSPGSRFCSGCGRPASVSDVTVLLNDEVTRLAPAAPRGSNPTSGSGPSGWLSTSGSIDHGRFGPGMVLDNRYRVLGLLGRGGMGEVYRADDLRLGQQVALKFLPADLSRDPARLAQFHNEVRTARHVSHPNVCRVYDVGEIDGQLFITMEYVDGEDLSILLRRIGRLPEDKGLEIARQICAGLAAAHERGVLHRDLKPANIMLDGAGKVRVMDFSLAAVGDVKDIRAGTPAYMAPEQLSGQEVTVRSDIYALGLVLYEIFTGRRAFEAKTLTELIEQHRSGTLTAPTTLVKALDPAIELAIVRCLDAQPARRPASAIGVSASLPGGDPLAAALAAGETPSPEMVAAAGGDSATLTPIAGLMWLAAVAALVLGVASVMGRQSLLARIPPIKPAAVLADRAEELRQSFGFVEPVADRASWFSHDDAYLRWVTENETGAARWAQLGAGRPAALRFWHRTSPRPLLPVGKSGPVSAGDPPLNLNGMTSTMLDGRGRLLRFEAAPPHAETAAAAPVPGVDWSRLFAAAGLDQAAFSESTPSRTPATYADERKAWTGSLPGTKIPVSIEAAGYRGRPMLFEMIAPWTTTPRDPGPRSRQTSNSPIFIYVLLSGAALTAYANVRRGRADMKGALRLAAFTFLLMLAIWTVSLHVDDVADEQQRFFVNVGVGLFVAAALYLLYLGLEPFVRRAWPTMLVGWSRLLGGRVRDPLIGRDLLLGAAAGAALALMNLANDVLPMRLGLPEAVPHVTDPEVLMGMRGLAVTLLRSVNNGLQNAVIMVFEFAVLRWLFEWVTGSGVRWAARRWAWAGKLTMHETTSKRLFVAVVLAVAAILALDDSGPFAQRALNAGYQVLTLSLTLLVLFRLGIFAAAIMYFVNTLLLRVQLTLDGSAVPATEAWAVIAGVLALAAAGFWMARADEPWMAKG